MSLCLTEIPRKDIVEKVVRLEHIIPQHSTRERFQPTGHTPVGVKSARSGLTITCTCCNSRKRSELDFPLINRIVPGPHTSGEYTFSTRVAILTYGYLFGFALFRYQYILKAEFGEVREQFAKPKDRVTPLLDKACVNLGGTDDLVVCNEWDYPFLVAETRRGQPIELFFWRFRVELPSLEGVTHL